MDINQGIIPEGLFYFDKIIAIHIQLMIWIISPLLQLTAGLMTEVQYYINIRLNTITAKEEKTPTTSVPKVCNL